MIVFLISYDACSLFTTITLQETFEIAVDLVLENNPKLKVTKHELKQLFNFVTSGPRFIFNSSFYNQIDGLSMKSPLGCAFTSLLRGYHEKKKRLREFKEIEGFLCI